MPYINKVVLKKFGLKFYDIPVLELIKQNSSKEEDNSVELEYFMNVNNRLERFLEKKYIKFNTTPKKDSEYQRIRLTPKGNKALEYIRLRDVTEKDIELFKDLITIYQSLNHKVGNKMKVQRDITWFKGETNLCNESILMATKAYIDYCREKFVPNLENLFWKSSNVFSTRQKLSESKFYQFIEDSTNLLKRN
jgi:hypothetical protein